MASKKVVDSQKDVIEAMRKSIIRSGFNTNKGIFEGGTVPLGFCSRCSSGCADGCYSGSCHSGCSAGCSTGRQ